jgi:pimeloyl-ACP methyl ester carboxylesterase
MSCAATSGIDAAGPSRHAARSGELVLFLHGSAASSATWKGASAALHRSHRCIAPDLIGYGRSDPWPAGAAFDLDCELRAIEHLLPCCAGYHLVGHSYGGVVALRLALRDPARVRTLTLIEPVLFAALRHAGEHEPYGQFARLRADYVATLSQGCRAKALGQFIDFWSGDGAWLRLSNDARAAMLRVADKIVLDWQATFAFDPSPHELASLAARTLLIGGSASPAPMRRLVDSLHALMPGSSRLIVDGADHLLPFTHGRALNDALQAHLQSNTEPHSH